MSNLYQFPEAVPFDAALKLASIVRSGQLTEKRGEAVQHAAWLGGSIGVRLSGDEAVAMNDADDACPDDLMACAAIVVEHSSDDGNASLNALNPLLLIAIEKLVSLVLQELLK